MRLTEPLPLRLSTEWREFQTITPLPRRYGRDVWGECIPYSQDLRRWVFSGHASQSVGTLGPVDRVAVDGVSIDGYTSRNAIDSAGKPVTLIILAEALDPGRQVQARGRGVIDPDSGKLIENPADVVRDLARLHGWSLSRSDVTQFAQECAARNLRLSMSIEQAEPLQDILRRIADQLCAVYAPTLPGWFRLLPLSPTHTPLITASDDQLGQASASHAGRADQITARYAYRFGAPTQTITIKDRAALNPLAIDVDFDMLSDVAAVTDVVSRMLARRARSPVNVTVDLPGMQPPGTPVAVDSLALGQATAPVLASSYNPGSDRSDATIELQLSALSVDPLVVSSSEQVTASDRVLPSIPIDGDQQLTIMGPNGPRAGAQVTLDERLTRVTDSAGVVVFPAALMTVGQHTLDIVAAGIDPYRLVITV